MRADLQYNHELTDDVWQVGLMDSQEPRVSDAYVGLDFRTGQIFMLFLYYLLQPKKINKEDNTPVKYIFLFWDKYSTILFKPKKVLISKQNKTKSKSKKVLSWKHADVMVWLSASYSYPHLFSWKPTCAWDEGKEYLKGSIRLTRGGE